ncbi:MAG: hypothetical protein GY702_02130 [Desulfobulbaceae bacterium]|nr:hypothetical protein [Desulfobulbaceae bacterium]
MANSSHDYTDRDVAAVERIAEIFALAIHRDDYETQRIEMEQDLRQLQKNEAIGALAGGIAHDFNIILTPIIGYTEYLKDDIPEDSPLRENVSQVLAAAERAIKLVKQILTFSRQHEQEIVPLRPHLVVKEAVKLIRSTILTTIEISSNIDDQCRTIMADPTQVHQVLMNLLTNAYHSMHDNGGVITVVLENMDLPVTNCDVNLDAGSYIVLTISDTGIGIDKGILDKIFDPYFTTKPQGKGTGLGLSVVYGIVKKYKGEMALKSRLGERAQSRCICPLWSRRKLLKKYGSTAITNSRRDNTVG